MIETRYGTIPISELVYPDYPSTPSLTLPKSNLCAYRNVTINKSVHYISGNSPHLVRIPLKVNPKLAYLVGYFYGDAGFKDIERSKITSDRYEYKIIIADEFKEQINIIKNLLEELFNVKTIIRTERKNKGENCYYINPTCKILYKFLVEQFEFPSGPKTRRIKIPKVVLKNKTLTKWFLRGFLDADGDTRAVESFAIKKKLSSPRIKVRIVDNRFIYELKFYLNKLFDLRMTGPYLDRYGVYIQCALGGVKKARDVALFYHPIKRWRLNKFVEIKENGSREI